jgi:hypothetical protein
VRGDRRGGAGRQALRSKIFSSAPVKSLNGRNLDGAMLCSLAEAYAAALNSGSSLNIGDAWSQVPEAPPLD